jgi:hypothetical protein
MINAETLSSIDAVRTATGFDFCDWVHLGTPVGIRRTLPHIENIPYGIRGIYIVGIKGVDGTVVPIYGGKCAAKGEGIRRRIQHEFDFKQNEGSGRECRGIKKINGPSHVHCSLSNRGISTDYFATFVVKRATRDAGICLMEKEMLSRVDFLANSKDNKCRRLGVLKTLFPSFTAKTEVVDEETEIADLKKTLKEKDILIAELRAALALEKAKTAKLLIRSRSCVKK